MIPSPIFVAGHRGMVGAAVCRRLSSEPGIEVLTRSRSELDLCDEGAVARFFEREKPATVIFASAKVGGIHANKTFPVEFLTDNLRQELATIHASYRNGVQRFLFLGSTCIYPRLAKQPIREDELLSSPLEPTNEAYALAKIAGLKLCQYFRQQYGVLYHSAMPTNLYGPGDNYHPDHSHVLPGLIRRFHEAKLQRLPSVTIWGTGRPLREFLHVDDLADAIIHLCKLENPPDWVNVGTSVDVSILQLAKLVAQAVGYEGEILTDPSKPDGTPRKLTDTTLIRSTGWAPKISLHEGLQRTYQDFLKESEEGNLRSI
ncbi:MAG: GDP-L-fucose synthase [Pirellula sp.]|jgi:GDP-L-fucose synthase|nr:GDP-L-fucose synthase [Pirellula sp.]